MSHLITEAIESFRRQDPDSKTPLALASNILVKAEKFIVPSPNRFRIKVTENSRPWLRMPYPIMAIEYEMDKEILRETSKLTNVETYKSSKRIALAIDITKHRPPWLLLNPDMDRGIIVTSFYTLDNDPNWQIAIGFLWFDTTAETELLVDDNHYSCMVSPVLYSRNVAGYVYDRSRGMTFELIQNDVAEELAATLKTLALLNAKNTNTITLPVSEKLNRKRIKNRKVPFFEYKTVDIFLDPSQQGKRIRPQDIARAVASRKLGTVRGHFKCRKTGIFWWSDHMRGSSAQGEVNKTYRISTP